MITFNVTLTDQTSLIAQPIALDIVYEDEAILIINKPAGLVVHPGAGNPDKTLVNALLHHAPTLSQLPRAGLIHRLDKDTSGLLMVAKTLTSHTNLVQQLQQRDIQREYAALVQGVIIAGGEVNAPIGRHPRFRTKMAVVANGKTALTHYRIVERFAYHTQIKLLLATGRTHQIRVHMAHIHHPLIGDPTYGGRNKLPKAATATLIDVLQQFKRQALHAKRLSLTHPTSHEPCEFIAPLPTDMQTLITALRQHKEHVSHDS